jgi:hypothetical protein
MQPTYPLVNPTLQPHSSLHPHTSHLLPPSHPFAPIHPTHLNHHHHHHNAPTPHPRSRPIPDSSQHIPDPKSARTNDNSSKGARRRSNPLPRSISRSFTPSFFSLSQISSLISDIDMYDRRLSPRRDLRCGGGE